MNDSVNQRLEKIHEKLRLLNEGDREMYMITSARGFLDTPGEGLEEAPCRGQTYTRELGPALPLIDAERPGTSTAGQGRAELV
jgi:hypothetical protein